MEHVEMGLHLDEEGERDGDKTRGAARRMRENRGGECATSLWW